jgi:hypothetical protein
MRPLKRAGSCQLYAGTRLATSCLASYTSVKLGQISHHAEYLTLRFSHTPFNHVSPQEYKLIVFHETPIGGITRATAASIRKCRWDETLFEFM